MSRYTILILCLFSLHFAYCQNENTNCESKTHIFWQESRKLNKNDFQGDGSSNARSRMHCDSLNLCTVASVGVYSVLDIPKKEKDRGRLLEKAYFVPMFEKATSYSIPPTDSIDIMNQQIVFDIYELSARMSRKKLKEFLDLMPNAYGGASIMFKTIDDDASEYRKKMVGKFTRETYILQKDSAYHTWRVHIDNALKETEQFKTSDDDRLRAITKKPIDKAYIMPNTIMGNLFDNDKK